VARTARVIDRDFGWKAYLETVNRIERERPDVVVGLFGPDAEAMHGQAKGSTVAQLGATHEFGLGVPECSFLRSTFDLNKDKYLRFLVRGMGDEIYAAAKDKRPFGSKDSKTLKQLALKMEGDVKLRIGRRQIPPPNAPSTIARKGSSTPLVDSGQMRRAITSDVRIGGKR